MLDIKTAVLIRNSIKNKTHINIALEDICRMQPITTTVHSNSYTILGLQTGDLTILVWVQFSEKLGIIVRNINTQAW